MPESITDQLRLSIDEETTYGVASSGTYEDLPITAESLKKAVDYTKSPTIRTDRQIDKMIKTGERGEGGIDFILRYSVFDLLLEAALFSADWSSEVSLLNATANVAITTTPATGNIAATGAFTNAVVGQWVRFKNMTGGLASMANSVYKILSKTDNDNIIVAGAVALPSGTQAASVSVNGIIDMGSQIVNGVESRSFTVEKNFTDLTNMYHQMTGMVVGGLGLSIPASGEVSGSFNFLGKNMTKQSSSSGGGYSAVPTNPEMNSIDDIAASLEGTPAVNTTNSININNFTLNLNNNLRERSIVGQAGPLSIGSGKCDIGGTLQAYFADATQHDKFFGDTASALAKLIKDSLNNIYIIDIPNIQYTQGDIVAGSENADFVQDFSWEAIRHATEDVTLRIVRFAA